MIIRKPNQKYTIIKEKHLIFLIFNFHYILL
jgi:hypothetical protein